VRQCGEEGSKAVLTTPTVFVLGAGASADYGFPLGKELCNSVIDHFDRLLTIGGDGQMVGVGDPFFEALRKELQISEEELRRFTTELLYSAQPSVDSFLEYRPEFMDIGKAAMAALLISQEHETKLWNFSPNNWMKYIFDFLRSPFEKFHENKVAFITFNYDRSLEHFLFRSLQSTFGKSQEECAAVLKCIPLIHLHGYLGLLPWQGKNGRPYERVINAETLKICMDNIKIVHEDVAERDAEFQKAKQLMRDATRVYFLGFGYAATNMERLDVATLDATKTWGTGIGISDGELLSIQTRSNRRIEVRQDWNCIGLLRAFEWG
jgi:hypothetical protein